MTTFRFKDGYKVHRENSVQQLFCSEPHNGIVCIPMYGFEWKPMQMLAKGRVSSQFVLRTPIFLTVLSFLRFTELYV